jgi:putative ABC transport system substrate-binding protein
VKRREFIAGLCGAAAWSHVTRAQQPAMPVIGFLISQSTAGTLVTVAVFQSLKEAGFIEGQNVAVEYRYAENQYDRLPALAADPPCSGDHNRRHLSNAGGEGSDHDYTDRLRHQL